MSQLPTITADAQHEKSVQGLAALLTAIGTKPIKIRKQLGISKAKYNLFLQSGVFNALVAEYRRKLLERGLDDAATLLMADATHNVDFLKKLRDGDIPIDDAAAMGVRLRASQTLFDKQFPKNQDGGLNAPVVEKAMRAIANAVCKEIGEEIEVEAVPIDLAIEEMEKAK